MSLRCPLGRSNVVDVVVAFVVVVMIVLVVVVVAVCVVVIILSDGPLADGHLDGQASCK